MTEGGETGRERDGGKEAMNGDWRTRGWRRKSEKRWKSGKRASGKGRVRMMRVTAGGAGRKREERTPLGGVRA